MRGIPVKEWDAETADSSSSSSSLANSTMRLTQSHGSQHFGFMLQLEGAGGGVGGEKDVLLRVGSVDVLIKWMNSLAAVLTFSLSLSLSLSLPLSLSLSVSLPLRLPIYFSLCRWFSYDLP
jgi:hypothetical protein